MGTEVGRLQSDPAGIDLHDLAYRLRGQPAHLDAKGPHQANANPARPRRKQVPLVMRIFARPDRGNAQSARSRLTDVIKCPFQNFLSRLNHLCDFKESHLIRGETANVDA
jgi:hypothetical protein